MSETGLHRYIGLQEHALPESQAGKLSTEKRHTPPMRFAAALHAQYGRVRRDCPPAAISQGAEQAMSYYDYNPQRPSRGAGVPPSLDAQIEAGLRVHMQR